MVAALGLGAGTPHCLSRSRGTASPPVSGAPFPSLPTAGVSDSSFGLLLKRHFQGSLPGSELRGWPSVPPGASALHGAEPLLVSLPVGCPVLARQALSGQVSSPGCTPERKARPGGLLLPPRSRPPGRRVKPASVQSVNWCGLWGPSGCPLVGREVMWTLGPEGA